MAQLSSILRSFEGGRLAFRCPGCKEIHQINVGNGPGPRWTYNQNPDRPTFMPSILVTWSEPSDVPEEFDDTSKDKQLRCHSYVTDGQIQFLSDCTHDLVNQTVPLPAWEA